MNKDNYEKHYYDTMLVAIWSEICVHLTSIPVLADNQGTGEIDVPVNFGGVTFLPEDYLYADNTGIILSPEALDLE